MGLFKKKGNDNTEIVEGLKSLVERGNDFLTSGIGIDKEHKALFTLANDETKAEVEKVLGIPIDDFMLGIKNNEFLISYWLPLAAATIFLGTTDVNKLQKDNELPAILNNPLPELADWEEVFNNLLLLPSSVLNFYIARMDCTNKAKKIILDALLKPDFASFEKCVENMGSESDLLKNVADWYKVVWGFYSIFTEGADNKNQEIMANNSFSSIEEEEGDFCRTVTDLAESLPLLEENITPEIISKINYENMKSIYLLNMNLYLKSRADYLKERDSYPKEIQDIVDPYVVDPEEIDFYVELKKRGCTFDAIEDNGTDEVSFDDQVILESERGLSGEDEEGVQMVKGVDEGSKKADDTEIHNFKLKEPLSDSELEKLYTSLVKEGFVSRESRKEDLAHVLGGSRPDDYKRIVWIKQAKNHTISKKSVLAFLRCLEVDWGDFEPKKLNYCFDTGKVPFKDKNLSDSRSGFEGIYANSDAVDDLYKVTSMVFGEDSKRYKDIIKIPLIQDNL